MRSIALVQTDKEFASLKKPRERRSMILQSYNRQKRITALFFSTLLLVFGVSTLGFAEKKTSVTVIPFVSGDKKPRASASTYSEISDKLEEQLKSKGFKIESVKPKSGEATFKLPNEDAFKDGMRFYKRGRQLLKMKKARPARMQLERAIEQFEEGLVHVKDFEIIYEIHRLLGLSYIRQAMNEQAEKVITRLGHLAPKQRYSIRQMTPLLRRMLKSAQGEADSQKGRLYIYAPKGSVITINNRRKVTVTRKKTLLDKLLVGKNYIFIKKPGFVPYAVAAEAKDVKRRRKIPKLRVKLQKMPKNARPNFTSEVNDIKKRLSKQIIDPKVRDHMQKIGEGFKVDYVFLGYFVSKGHDNVLELSIFRVSDSTLKKYDSTTFSSEFLQADIKMVPLVSKLMAKLKAFDAMPGKSWASATAYSALVSQATSASARAAASSFQITSKAKKAVEKKKEDEEEDPLLAEMGGTTKKKKPKPRPVVRKVAPPPVKRREPPKSEEDPDDPLSTDRPVRLKPKRQPEERREPPPRRVEPVVRKVAPPPVRRVKRAPKRVAVAKRATRRAFDPDRDIDWSNPIPTGRRRSNNDENMTSDLDSGRSRRTRRTRRTRRKVIRDPERRKPPEKRVEEDPDEEDPDEDDPDAKKTKKVKPKRSRALMYGLIGGGAVVVGAVAVITIYFLSPINQYSVSVDVNPQ